MRSLILQWFISGQNGPGILLKSRCTLHCVYCERYNISNAANRIYSNDFSDKILYARETGQYLSQCNANRPWLLIIAKSVLHNPVPLRRIKTGQQTYSLTIPVNLDNASQVQPLERNNINWSLVLTSNPAGIHASGGCICWLLVDRRSFKHTRSAATAGAQPVILIARNFRFLVSCFRFADSQLTKVVSGLPSAEKNAFQNLVAVPHSHYLGPSGFDLGGWGNPSKHTGLWSAVAGVYICLLEQPLMPLRQSSARHRDLLFGKLLDGTNCIDNWSKPKHFAHALALFYMFFR